MFEIDILRNHVPKDLGVLRGDFWGIGCPVGVIFEDWVPKRHPGALLAKTMSCILFPHNIVQNNNTRLHYPEPADLLRPVLIVHYGRLKQ